MFKYSKYCQVHSKMKSLKLASLFALFALAVFSASIASAQAIITFNPNSIGQSIVAGQSATISFNVTNSGNSSTSLTWSSSISPATVTFSTPSSISAGVTVPASATIAVPSTASGTINGVISVLSNTGISTSLPITITVTPSQQSFITISGPSAPLNIGQNATFVVTNTGTTPLSITMSEISSSLFGLNFNPRTFSLSSTQQQSVLTSLSSAGTLRFGINTIDVKADAGTQSATSSFQVKKTFCSSGETLNGNLSIENVDWSNSGEGSDNTWELLDEVEVEVKVRNNNNNNDVDAVVELGLFDSSGRNVANDLTFLSDSDSSDEKIDVNINDDDRETVTWRFKVPANFDKGEYRLAVKAYSDDAGESRDCRDSSSDLDNNFYQLVSVREASDKGRYVIVDDISMDSQVTCSQTASGQFTVYNIGKNDEDRVRVLIRIKDLGINLEKEIISNMDKGDDKTLDFSFKVPSTASNGNHLVEFITQYDYRNGVYREESDNSFTTNFEVLGCSENLGTGSGGLTNTVIDARLGSEAKAGKELVIVATIKNTGNEEARYSLSARGYSSWADLTDISPGSITVAPGDTQEVTFRMLVNDDAQGRQSFDIQASQNGRTQVQEVEVQLSSSASGLSIFSSDNYLIWIIGLVNLVLIILIIVVAVKLARR